MIYLSDDRGILYTKIYNVPRSDMTMTVLSKGIFVVLCSISPCQVEAGSFQVFCQTRHILTDRAFLSPIIAYKVCYRLIVPIFRTIAI